MAPLPGETYWLAFPSLPNLDNPAYVCYGRPHHEACAHRVKNTFDAKRAYIVASASLSKKTDEVEKLKKALGDRLAGVRVGIAPHTPWDEVVDATKDALEKRADCLITIGGGSLVDGAKAMLLFMANNVITVPDVLEFGKKIRARLEDMHRPSSDLPCISPSIPLICIPTTLSGGEYTQYGGGTDPKTHQKSIMGHPFCGPRLIINDPKLTIIAPEWVWLSTGVRGIDHCVEIYCRMHQPDEMVDEAAIEGFKLIVPNLLLTKQDWTNEEARLNSMLGVNAVTIAFKRSILQEHLTASATNWTSCVLLPSVMKWNARVNGEKQERLKKVMWSEAPVSEVLRRRGLEEDGSDAGDALDAIFRELGMPRSLKEVGVGRDKFNVLAANSLEDFCCPNNPIPLETESQVLAILEMCAG